MTMDLREYLRLQCSEMLVMERDILRMNDMMARESTHPKLKEAFERHSHPTHEQISNLEQVVDRLGGITGPQESPVTRGLAQAHQQFISMNPPQEFINIHNAMAGDKVEHMEMAIYSGLIALAQAAGETEIATMLQRNLLGEQQMCTVLEGELPNLLAQAGGQRRAA